MKTGSKHTAATRAQMSASHRGKKFSPEHRAKIGEANRGRKHTKEMRARLSAARKKITGWKHSPETRAKISASAKGKPKSPELRAKISATLLGVKLSPERCANMSAARKKQWATQEYRDMIRKAWDLRPNKHEAILIELLDEKFPDAWKYTGDLSFVINGKNPDFVCCNGQKKIIEYFGEYWHKPEDEQERMDAFAPYGYATLVIWERELRDLVTLAKRIKQFMQKKQPRAKGATR